MVVQGFIIPVHSSSLQCWKEPQNPVELCSFSVCCAPCDRVAHKWTHFTLCCSPFCRFSLLSKQYLFCCSVIPQLVALLTTAWWADWILHSMFFFSLSAVFLSPWYFFFSLLGSLKFICVSPSVFPKSGLKLTEDLWVLSWAQRFLSVSCRSEFCL